MYDIPGVPRCPFQLRKEICQSLRYLPIRWEWIEGIFNNDHEAFDRFVEEHSRTTGQTLPWTDPMGLITSATAYYLGKILTLKSQLTVC